MSAQHIALNASELSGQGRPPPPFVREAVRDVLEQAPAYVKLDAIDRRALANAMVKVSTLAAHLILAESHAQNAVAAEAPPPRRPALARAQAAPDFGAATDRLASTTRNVLNAVSFPRFVTDLINGVFKAMLDSNAQQMHQYVDLLNNVSASLEGFADSQFSEDAARSWLAEKFPVQFEVTDPAQDEEGPVAPEDREPRRLKLRDGAQMPGAEAMRAVFGMGPDEPLEIGTPEKLVPLAKIQIARQRQQMLATMVMLGMQRIVIDSGSIHASMRFHIDTRSAANSDEGSSFNLQNRVKASGQFAVGPWGASAEVENNIGYVSTQRSQSSEEMNTDLDLSSSVDINFRSDYVPLNRMATAESAARIRENSLNPDTEAALAKARNDRRASQGAAELERQKATAAILTPGGTPAPAKTPEPVKSPASAKTPEPSKAPQPSKAPEPSKAPAPAKNAAPARKPQPAGHTAPAKTPAPAA